MVATASPGMETLLPWAVTRSEQDPDLEAAVVANTGTAAEVDIAMHPITGTFADPSLEAAFSAWLFRLAFPVHAFLMSVILAFAVWVALASPPELRALWGMITIGASLGLVGRALLHRMHDSARAQRVGSWTWALVLLLVADVAVISGLLMAPASTCELERKANSGPLVAMASGLINGSHGMRFVHKSALVGFTGLTRLFVAGPAICHSAFVAYEAGALILGAAVAQMAELYMRNSYAEKQRADEDKRRLEERNEQLQAEKERLLYDMQQRGHPLDDDDDRSAVRRGLQSGPSRPYRPAGDPSEAASSTPSDSAPPSLPPGPPSSSTSSSTAPPLTWEEANQRQAAGAEERVHNLVDQLPDDPQPVAWLPPSVTWEEANAEERVGLAELAALAEMADDETVHNLVVKHLIPAQLNLQMASAMPVSMEPMLCSAAQLLGGPATGRLTLRAPFNTQPNQQYWTLPLSGFGTDPSELNYIFAQLFTPKHPGNLPRTQWVSYTRMLLAVQPLAPARVYKQGPGNLKQLVVQWCRRHPAFAGLAQSAWCKRLPDHDQQALPGRSQPTVYKFCFEFTLA